MLSNNVVEMPISLTRAEKSFASYGFKLLGWYRSSLANSYTPTVFDLEKQFFLKNQVSNRIGMAFDGLQLTFSLVTIFSG